MSRLSKNQLLEIVDSMDEAYAFISGFENNFSAMNQSQVLDVLESCREAAVAIGNTIEELGESAIKTIDILVDYCEQLYNQSLVLNDEKEFKRISQKIGARLKRIRNSINNDLVFKKKVVFFPYKASMWDALESVWKAAVADETCEVSVVPIPYFDRNEDLTAGEMHYEGDLYPDYVPVVDWQKYDVSKEKPDVAYIHNPYDEFNRVTSVHPHYYSYQLKKNVRMLVYIPYYVLAKDSVQKSFCTASGIEYADRVVIQSQSLKDVFETNYKEFFEKKFNIPKEQKDDFQKCITQKFVALGSPKFDAIVNAKKSDFTIPDEWREIIGNKKIVMYNVSLRTLISDPSLYMKKIRKTIEFFEASSDYVLWWRPHPLFRNTIANISQKFLAEYDEMVSHYKENKIGVYDDTSELQRAIILSDIYYGDSKSSVFVLFCATGKLVVFAHIENNSELTTFEEDMRNHYRDNSSLDALKRNENYDGTAGKHIHNYIMNEVI